MAYQVFPASRRTILLFRLNDALLRVRAVVRAVINRRKLAAELRNCTGPMLNDIGLTPEDVAGAFAEPWWSDPSLRLSVLAVERRANHRKALAQSAPAYWAARRAANPASDISAN